MLTIFIFFLYLGQIAFKLIEQQVNALFILLNQLSDLCLVLLLHFQLCLLQVQKVCVLIDELLFVHHLKLLHLCQVIALHLLHRLEVLLVLKLLLPLEIGVALLEIFDIQVFLLFYLEKLSLELLLLIFQLDLDAFLRQGELVLQLSLALLPCVHSIFLYKHNVS